jgi:hypothetical protein
VAVPHLTRRPSSRQAALVELQRLHAAIQASRERRGLVPAGAPVTPEARAARDLTRRLQTPSSPDLDREAATPSRSRRGLWLLVAAVLVAGIWGALTFGQRRVNPEAVGPVPRPAPPNPTPATPSASPGAPLASAPAASPAAPARDPAVPAPALNLSLDTIREAWLLVTVDGRRAYRGTAAAGERLTFTADRAVVVRSGDAGAVRVTVNGADRGALGLRGWPLTVSITPEGIEPLTPTRPEP